MNTHRAVIESSVPPSLTLVGSGPKDFCEKQLVWWIERHPLGEFEEARVLQVTGTDSMHITDGGRDTRATKLVEDLREHTKFEAGNAVEASLQRKLAKACRALDDLLYIANHRADLSKPVGQWWSEVIKGNITRALEGK